MSRRSRKFVRTYEPDPVFGSLVVARFINKVMRSGKKSIAESIVYGALERLAKETSKPVLEAFTLALKNVTPLMEVKSRRVGGSTYQVPVEVRPDRGVALAMKWIIDSARGKAGRPMLDRLFMELMDSFKGTGASCKKREDTHRMAEANKAFAHFRW